MTQHDIALAAVLKAARAWLDRIDTITTAEFERGGERAQRIALADALEVELVFRGR